MIMTGVYVPQPDERFEHRLDNMASEAQLVDDRSTVNGITSPNDSSRSIHQPDLPASHNVTGPREYKRLLSHRFDEDGNVQYLVEWKPTWEDSAVLGQIEQALNVYVRQVGS